MSFRDDFPVRLTFRDADHLLALAEWALGRPDLDLGPGLERSHAEFAARKIEAVGDLARHEIVADEDKRFAALLQHCHRTTHRAVVPFGDCRMCDELVAGLAHEFGYGEAA